MHSSPSRDRITRFVQRMSPRRRREVVGNLVEKIEAGGRFEPRLHLCSCHPELTINSSKLAVKSRPGPHVDAPGTGEYAELVTGLGESGRALHGSGPPSPVKGLLVELPARQWVEQRPILVG